MNYLYICSVVKKLFSFIIILQLFSNQEAFAELAKLPFLFHHYSETGKQQNFIDFLNEHYTSSDDQNDDHEHGKLPFKHSDDGCSHHASTVLKDTKPETNLCLRSIGYEVEKYPITNEQNFPTYFNNIWQPPKLG